MPTNLQRTVGAAAPTPVPAPLTSVPPTASTAAEVVVAVVHRAADQSGYASLLDAQRRWIEEELGLAIGHLQPHARDEYADPFLSYRGSGTIALLARASVRPVGICALRPLAEEPGTVELKRVFVHPAARGLGVGRALVDAAVGVARRRRAERVVLETHEGYMPAAAALYRSLGFVDAEPLGATRHPDVLTMALALAPERESRQPLLMATS